MNSDFVLFQSKCNEIDETMFVIILGKRMSVCFQGKITICYRFTYFCCLDFALFTNSDTCFQEFLKSHIPNMYGTVVKSEPDLVDILVNPTINWMAVTSTKSSKSSRKKQSPTGSVPSIILFGEKNTESTQFHATKPNQSTEKTNTPFFPYITPSYFLLAYLYSFY